CACARYQVNPKVSHLYAVKRIFRYLKGQPKLGLWYPKDSPFDLIAYTDSDYAGSSLDLQQEAKTINGEVQLQALVDGKKIIKTGSTVGRDLQLEDVEGVDFLPNATIFEQLALMGAKTTAWNEFSSTMASAIICLATNQKFNFSKYIFKSMVKNLDNLSGKFLMYPRKPKRKDSQIPQSSGPTNVANEAVYKELDDSLVRAATTAFSLEAKQDIGNIDKTQSKETPNEAGSQGTTSSGGPRRQETIGDTTARTRFESASKLYNDPLLARVLDLEKTKITQANEIDSLKRKVKRLKKKKRLRTHWLKRLYKVALIASVESSRDEECLGEAASKQGRINAIDADEDTTLFNDQDDDVMFDVNTMTALAALKSVKPKVKVNVVEEPNVHVSAANTKVSAAITRTTATIPARRKGIVITELGTSTTTTISSQPLHVKVQDKGKGIMVEEHMKSMTKKDLVRLDEEIASKLQAEFDKEERLAREKDEANVALTEEWDDIQAKVDADYQLAQRLQAQEQEELTDEEKARLFVQFLEQRRKYFAAKRAEEKRNKPPTQAQQRKIMCTYLKNMEGKKPKDLKNKSFNSIQKMFDKAFKRVNTFVDFRTDLVEEIAELDDDQEADKIKELMEIVPDKEEVAIDAIPLAVKPPSIVDWKIHKEGKKTYYQIIRADGSSKMPKEGYERVLWSDLKVMFEPHVEDTVWRNQQDYRVLEWKLYDSCGVHFLRMQPMQIYMLVEKKYYLTPATITDMLNKKLQCDHFSEMAYQLLKLLTKQLKNP
ncbi:hypothetical protein Tco_0611046, partial [Tanacetum coccineum]